VKLMGDEQVTGRWTLPGWVFYEIEGHGFPNIPGPIYRVERDGAKPHQQDPDSYRTLDEALAQALAAKYCGVRGAGGTGVGTAADWFLRSIGAGQLAAVPDAEALTALLTAFNAAEGFPPVGLREVGRRVLTDLESKGYVLARQAGS